MPILSYFAAIGSALVALLFVADMTLEKRTTPIIVSSEFIGLPQSYGHVATGSRLIAEPAPAPDMNSAAVKAAMPAPQVAPAIAEIPKVVAAETTASGSVEHPREKKKQVVRRPVRSDERQNYAWSPTGETRPFGGSSFFGRF